MSNRLNCMQSLITLLILTVVTSGCINETQYAGTPTLIAERELRPTPASTLPELIENLSSDEILARVVSAYALRDYDPDEVAVAVPKLVKNLYYDYTEVQLSAAFLLGWLGSRARQAVPDLIATMENNENAADVRYVTASALGEIGDDSAVPALAKQLYQDSEFSFHLQINCANSIAILANQKFRDAGSTANHFSDDIPWIVTDARSWWEQTGQYQEW